VLKGKVEPKAQFRNKHSPGRVEMGRGTQSACTVGGTQPSERLPVMSMGKMSMGGHSRLL
jgi:hypothetical protein